MDILSKKETIKYIGGASVSSAGIFAIVSAIISFALGVFQGFNTKTCIKR